MRTVTCVADYNNNAIRKITPSAEVSTVAGTGVPGLVNGDGAQAQFTLPYGVTRDQLGNLYVADTYNHVIRKITPAGVVTTFAGSVIGFADGTGASAKFSSPSGITIDNNGNLYVTDGDNNRIRKITAAGAVSTLAGSETSGFADGQGTAAKFTFPIGICFSALGNLYVGDYGNHRIRKVSLTGMVTTVAGTGETGFSNAAPESSKFSSPQGVFTDVDEAIYIADFGIGG